jgi:hypothetical protein
MVAQNLSENQLRIPHGSHLQKIGIRRSWSVYSGRIMLQRMRFYYAIGMVSVKSPFLLMIAN